MNCLYEAIAGMYVRARNSIAPPPEDDLGDAEENLEACRAGMVSREVSLERQCSKLAATALSKKQSGDLTAARFALVERKRVHARLDKVRGSISLIDKQLDALRTSELDKELMNSLKLSSQAMKKAGIGQGLEEAESVMNELDDQIREASELTTVLATPLVNSTGEEDDGFDLEEELGILEKEQAVEGSVLATQGVDREPRPHAQVLDEQPRNKNLPQTEKQWSRDEPQMSKHSRQPSRIMDLIEL
jgi:hypothetical protein